jgi:hypothetical protein
MRVVPLTATAVGLALTAGAVFTIDTASSTLDLHRVAFVVPADIADGSGSDGSGGCPPGSACMRPPGVPLTANSTSSGSTGSSDSASSNTTPPLPVPGSDPDEIASHHAKPSTGDLGAGPTGSGPDPVAPAPGAPDEIPAPLPVTASSTGGGGTAAGGGGTAIGGGGTGNGTATGMADLSPNQAMDLVARVLSKVSKFLTSMMG